MAISLQKGQRIDLTKGKPGLSKLMVGLAGILLRKAVYFGRFSAGASRILIVMHLSYVRGMKIN